MLQILAQLRASSVSKSVEERKAEGKVEEARTVDLKMSNDALAGFK